MLLAYLVKVPAVEAFGKSFRDKEKNTYGDETVCNIKYGKVTNADEINDCAMGYSINGVADNASDEHEIGRVLFAFALGECLPHKNKYN